VKKLDSVKKKRVPLSASEAFVLQNTSIVEVTSVEILDSGHNLSSTKPSTAAYETHDSKAEGTHRGKYRAPTPSSEQNEALLSTTQWCHHSFRQQTSLRFMPSFWLKMKMKMIHLSLKALEDCMLLFPKEQLLLPIWLNTWNTAYPSQNAILTERLYLATDQNCKNSIRT
jgi:hypothetical protein